MTNLNLHDVATRYVAAWNETDLAQRQTLVAALWVEDATYRDPLMQGRGHAEIAGLIAAVQARFPGFRFALSDRPAEGYGDHLRFSWDLGPEGGEVVVQGTDYAQLDGSGRLRSVVGFLDRVPAGSDA